MMHLFYVITSVVLINTVHFFLRICTVQNNAYYLSTLEVPEVKNISNALFNFICFISQRVEQNTEA